MNTMPKFLFLIIVLLTTRNSSAQFYDWGWGAPIFVNQVGTTITCTALDPISNNTHTESFTSVAEWSHEDGVVATVSAGGVVRGITYDPALGNFNVQQFSSIFQTTVINKDGVVAWVTGSGTVGAAIYNPFQHNWQFDVFSSNSGNQMLNRDGVVSWVSAAGSVGAAVYDPAMSIWRTGQFSSNSGNSMQNADGVVAWVSSAGSLGAAVYDPSLHLWRSEQFSSNPGNVLQIGQGVVAWRSTAGSLGGAAYNFNTNSWDGQQFSSSASNTVPTITDGTVHWTNSGGAQKYGYTSAHQWQNNVNTAPQCEYYPVNVSGASTPPFAYLWCLSIGAASYAHQCGDGHTISRRWAWKEYASEGVYDPVFTVTGNGTISTCTGQLVFLSTGLDQAVRTAKVNAFFSNGQLRVTDETPLGVVEVYDASGRCAARTSSKSNNVQFQGPFVAGIYLIRVDGRDDVTTVRVVNPD